MSDDLLKAATQALRDEAADDDMDGRTTRARVMASLHQGKVKRRTRLAFVLPIAACLAAGTAWGAATGRLPAVFQAIRQMVSYRNRPAEAPKPVTEQRAPDATTLAAPPLSSPREVVQPEPPAALPAPVAVAESVKPAAVP